MPIFISQDLWLSGGLDDGYINANNPRIGYHNLINIGAIMAEYENPSRPATNIANVSTAEYWESSSDEEQHIEFGLGFAAWNYFGIAGHNLAGAIYQMQWRADPGDPWEDVTNEQIPGDNNAIMHLFETIIAPYARLKIVPVAGVMPKISVIYIGEYLTLQRRTYVGHTPIVYARNTDVVSGMSESGNFLGRVVKKRTLGTSALEQQNVSPDYYRSLIDPFVVHAQTLPFFMAWRPGQYPDEVGFCWATDDIVMTNQLANGFVNFTINVNALAPWPNESSQDEFPTS